MLQLKGCFTTQLLLLTYFLTSLAATARAHSASTVEGKVVDPLGAVVPDAEATLFQNGSALRTTKTDREGNFAFSDVPAGQYLVRVTAPRFARQDSQTVNVTSGGNLHIEVTLQIGTLRQQIVVTDTGTGLLESQVGASVTVLDQSELNAFNKLDLFDALRQVPGLAIVQSGQRGGATSIFARGGTSDFNKVLIDGTPANDIGGAFEFADLSASAFNQVEVFRGANSVLYGPDALGSVIQVTTRRGSSPSPQLTYAADGGNFNTLRQEASLGGVFHQFDYFADFMDFETANSLPNSSYHNETFSGNFGWQAGDNTDLRFTVRHTGTGLGLPNALAFYGIPDDAFQRAQDTYLGFKLQNQTTAKWRNSLQVTSTDLRYSYDEPDPTGIPYQGNYLGLPVIICGANGYCSRGQAILDYGVENGAVYPNLFNSHTAVQSLYGLSNYDFKRDFSASAGIRYDHESGYTNSAGSLTPTTRNNIDSFLEGHGTLGHRAFATAGVGVEDNAVYDVAVTPRVSAAYYLRRLSSDSILSGTKLRFNFGTGINEPSILNQSESLYNLLSTLPNGPQLISQYHVAPIGPERSRNFDWGIEQLLWGGTVRLDVTGFHERFFDLVAFVDNTFLPELGVPPAVAAAVPLGATVNSDSYRSLGVEVEAEARLRRDLRLQGTYTYTDAVVTQSFASSAQTPSYNPAFPEIAIGAYTPLIGGRPFGVPPNSGSVGVIYSRRRFGLSTTGYFVSRSDDSTFLSDENYGNTLLLPNRNLLNAYQLVDWSGWLDAHHGITLYASLGNLLGEHYQAALGYPALPFNFRAGLRFTLGREGWKHW
jgi:iron complex outermembrane receptor protein/vitamin B12 transporter